MDIDLLVKTASKAWALTILSLLHRGVPGRQAPLVSASGAGRTAFVQSLNHLVELGLIARNPGHGHPLRPEFVLTDEGKEMAALSHRIVESVGSAENALIRRNWTVPVLGVIGSPLHFSEIRTRIPPITDRALSLTLKTLENRSWVRREVDGAARPPRAAYLAIGQGAKISGAIKASLAGMQ